MNTTPKTPCAIYLRVSLDATGKRLAVERQGEDCERIAAERGWQVVETYVDNSISASDKNKKRPAYDRMVADFAAGRFSALVCYDLDRLTRQPRQLEDWIDAAEERGLLLVTANGEADLTTDGGRLFARIKASVARAEVERKGARQERALRQRADSGKPPLGVRLTGYETDGTIVPAEADIVRAIFARFTAGDSLRGIAAWLNTGPVKARGGNWTPSTVRTILMNPRYCGRAIYQGKPTGKLGQWKPIVTEGVFDSANARLSDPRRKSNKFGTERKYLGSGIYRCGECGDPMRSQSNHRYWCGRGGHIVRSGAVVDGFVTGVMLDWLSRPDFLSLLAKPQNPADASKVTLLRERLAQVERDYDEGLIDGRRYSVAVARIEAELDAEQLAQARASASGSVASIAGSRNPVAAFQDAPLGVQRAIIDEFLGVTLHRAPRGRKGFDPDSVTITRKGADHD